MSLQNVLELPMALQPDNEAHQFYVDGNYRFTPKTRANFKLAYTRATQNESFAGMGLADGTQPRPDLGGQVDTTLAQIGVTAHPLPRLTVNGNLRYEDRNDKTPVAVYNKESSLNSAGTTYTVETWSNSLTSNKKTSGKLEAIYLFPANLRGTFGIDYEKVERELPLTLKSRNRTTIHYILIGPAALSR